MIILIIASFVLLVLGTGGHKRAGVFSASGFIGVVTALVWGAVGASSLAGYMLEATAGLGVGCLLLAGRFHKLRQPSNSRPWLAIGLFLIIVSLLLGLGRAYLASPDSQSWLVELGPDDDISEIESVLAAHDVQHERAFPSLTIGDHPDLAQVYLLHGSPADLLPVTKLLRLDSENVDHLEPNLRLQFIDGREPSVFLPESRTGALYPQQNPLLENDPLAPSQWDLEVTGAHKVHGMLQSVRPVRRAKLAVLDTGVSAAHEDLAGVMATHGIRVDANGHGSHVAGTAAAATNNRLGVASINWGGEFIQIAAYQALSDNGTGTLEGIAQALVDAVRDDVDVISMSLGARRGDTTPKVIRDAITFALDHDIPVVVSAGNDGLDAAEQFPANIPGVIVVGALDRDLNRASFSNTTSSLERGISAPGVNILSVRHSGGYVSMSGTSMATPAVSGLLGLIRSLDPSLSAEDLWKLLHETATPTDAAAEIGPMINAGAAVERVLRDRKDDL